jgi:serine/threonine-protein kinase
MVKIGMILGERYEILEKIGTGGMSDVYKARCHKLKRFVAVKVLKQEFSENPTFVSKFRIEAQAAAGLMHPNIVNVYDVGEENGIYYIVMELVEGATLKEYIEKKARISYKEAVTIAIQVGMGIEAAHNNHIIHRDIKPQNIIISKDGKVKVTDFGIAKAASSNTITTNVMGSVHYTSPEQARGGYSDEKSDIYSLGITLFEMLTGRVPFCGDTTVAIAIKHIQEEMPSPNEFVPEIPIAVEQIVLKCCEKSPDRRYQKMDKLIADLKQAMITPNVDFVGRNKQDVSMSTRMVTETEMTQIKELTKQSRTMQKKNQGNPYPSDPYEQNPHGYPAEQGGEIIEDDDEYDEKDSPKMEKITAVLAVLAGLVILVILILIIIKVLDGLKADPNSKIQTPATTTESTVSPTQESSLPKEETTVKMPIVQGVSEDAAKNALQNLGLLTKVEYEESDTFPVGIVIKADAAPETQLEIGAQVLLTVSSGTQTVSVPDVTGKTFDQANRELTASGFLVNRRDEYSQEIEADNVISQEPTAGEAAKSGSAVTLTVSIGAEGSKVKVPNVIGLTESDGVAAINDMGLQVVSVSTVFHSEIKAGLICYQSYSADSYLEPGTGIEIRVSKGPETAAYKYEGTISAPTTAEAPDYVSGTQVDVQLVTDDGTILKDTTVTSFPESARFYGITAAAGTITFTYQVTVPGVTTTGPNGEVVTPPATTEDRSFTRRIEFTKE